MPPKYRRIEQILDEFEMAVYRRHIDDAMEIEIVAEEFGKTTRQMMAEWELIESKLRKEWST